MMSTSCFLHEHTCNLPANVHEEIKQAHWVLELDSVCRCPLPRHLIICSCYSTKGVTVYTGPSPQYYHKHPPHQSQDLDSEKSKSWTSHISQVERNELQLRVGGLESWPQTRQNSLIFNTWPSFQRHTQAHQPAMGLFFHQAEKPGWFQEIYTLPHN